jgi:hypothetical protein
VNHDGAPVNGKHGGKTSGGGKKQGRKASTVNVRNWLRLDQYGETSMIQADKWKLTHKLGVQGRDLRIMDPSLATSYPSAILCREKALVVSLEHIKVCQRGVCIWLYTSSMHGHYGLTGVLERGWLSTQCFLCVLKIPSKGCLVRSIFAALRSVQVSEQQAKVIPASAQH